ncbi:MAG: TrkH family potassium uptake protein [Candidatus Omnitrophica bacterium]|nr:TrkH family potassium uptake protein [Candidatus Omnitrophota bacterium]
MILRPKYSDIKIICYYLGKIILGMGLCMALPVLTGMMFGEWDAVLDFVIAMMVCFLFGFSFIRLFYTTETLGWAHGLMVASVSWLMAAFFGAIPLYLSGHFLSFLDAYFESMSGFATTGLSLIQQLDHVSFSHNMWRHFIMFIGGQGVVVIALTFLIKTAGAFTMYAGEARDEKILPNVIHTARFIWLVSLVYLALGTAALTAVGIFEGLPFKKAIFHAMWIFMAAWDTGGFTPQSQNILYYHSMGLEIITISVMFLGALNFKLHYAVWTGNKKELIKNIEVITLFITIITTFSLCAVGLARAGIYPHAISLFRKGFYQVISGHVGTGYSTIYARQFITEWAGLPIIATIIAMALGGCACSTAGGIKALRIGIIFKALRQDIKKMLLPEDVVVIQKFHHIRDIILEDKHLRSAAMIALCYLLLYFVGALAGMILGYSPLESLFESVSATANVGLSCGITNAYMPALLKLTYIFQMWIGRLEFMSVFVLFGFIISMVKGK